MAEMDLERLNRMPFAKLNNYRWTKAKDGEAEIVIDTKPEHGNGFEHLHGGMFAVLGDSVGTTALGSVDGMRALTVDLRINYVKIGDLNARVTARAKAVHFSGSTGFASIEILNAAGEILALGQMTCIMKPRVGNTA